MVNSFSSQIQKKICFNFVIFVATRKGRTTIFPPFSFVVVFGPGIRDPGSGKDKNHTSRIRNTAFVKT